MSIPTTNNAVDVFHQATDKRSWDASATLTDVPCYIEPLSAEKAMMYGTERAYDSYQIFCNVLDIRNGDKLVDQQGVEYFVHGFKKFNYNTDIENHMEVIAYQNAL